MQRTHLRRTPRRPYRSNGDPAGLVQNRRDHGGVIFIDLRGRRGLTQITFDADICGQADHDLADSLRSEWVIEYGTVNRGANANDNLDTGRLKSSRPNYRA